MHLDTLAGLGELKVCRAYRIDGAETTFFPSDVAQLQKAECIYETAAGWDQDLSDMTDFDQLPKSVRDYVALIEDIINVPISIVGVGPKRSQAIFRK